MNLSELTKILADESKAIEYVESLRWPSGEPTCPHCEVTGRAYRLNGKTTRQGLWKCGACRKQFSVRVGTIFGDSHIPLSKWLLAIHLMCSSKKGVSAKQIERELGITYKSAWFLCQRIRFAMASPEFMGKLGGGSGVVEVDETYIGGKASNNPHRGHAKKAKPVVMTLVERGGDVRTVHVARANREIASQVIRDNVVSTAHIMTDSSNIYPAIGDEFAAHDAVNHSKEYVRGIVHTNFAESYHSLLKRSIVGTFHHISAKHLHRYLAEFDFRWNSRKATDGARLVEAVMGAEGKRLTYKPLIGRE